ncbi:hypothetical protein [Nakamurella antarctica]|uniref:hypothetical protein n=1 Tax=Nakamurella antarctica TaxID=1902245 RepID=UPI0013DDB2F5|nr:hypothetical protein [Nakamurella antarctica]
MSTFAKILLLIAAAWIAFGVIGFLIKSVFWLGIVGAVVFLTVALVGKKSSKVRA